jgi:hypothetical protein
MAELTDDMREGLENVTAASEELLDALTSMIKTMKTGDKARKDEIKHLGESSDGFDDLNAAVRNSTDEQDRYKNAVAKGQEVFEDMSAGVKKATAVIGDMAASTLDGEGFSMFTAMIDPATDLMKNLGDVAGSAAGGLLKFGAGIPFVGGVFEGLGEGADKVISGLSSMAAGITNFVSKQALKATEQLWNMFEGATKAGVLVTGGMTEMQRQQKAMGLTTQEYVSFLKNSSNSLAMFGGTVGEGAKKIAAVADESGRFEQEIRGLGITYEEQFEMTSKFMSDLQRTGQLRALSDTQIAEQSYAYMKNLKAISTMTGQTVEEMQSEREAAARNIAVQANLSKYTGDVRTQMQALANTNIPGFTKSIQEVLALGRVTSDMTVLTTGMAPYVEDFVARISSGEMDMVQSMDVFRQEIKANAPELLEELNSFAAASQAQMVGLGDGVTSELETGIHSLRTFIQTATEATKTQVEDTSNMGKQLDEGTKNIISAYDAQRKLMGELLELASNNMPLISGLMKSTAETMTETFKQAEEIANDPTGWATKMLELVNPMQGLNDATGGAVGKLLEFNKWLGKTMDMDLSDVLISAIPGIGPAIQANRAFAGALGSGIDTVTGWFDGEDPAENGKNIKQQKLEAASAARESADNASREITALKQEIAEEKARIARSRGNENEYWGSEKSGQEQSIAIIDRLETAIAKMVEMQERHLRKADELTDAVLGGQ